MNDDDFLIRLNKYNRKNKIIFNTILTLAIIVLLFLIISVIYYNSNYIYKCYDIDNNIYYCDFMTGGLSKMKLRLPNGKYVQLKSYELIKRSQKCF